MKAALVDDDLRITFWGPSAVRYRGTRAQLLEEGLIGPETVFPEGRNTVTWMRDGVEYTLAWGHAYPARGPRKAPKDPDLWVLDSTVPGRDWRWAEQRRIEEIEAKLRAELHRQTPVGRREAREQLRRYVDASMDKDFRAFKRACMPVRGAPVARRSMPEGR